MKKRYNKGSLFVLAVLVAGIINTALYFATASYRLSSNVGGYLCPGIPYELGNGVVSGGVPLVSEVDREFYGTCGSIENTSAVNLVGELVPTQEYFINWAILSVPLILIAIIYKRHENTRD